MRNKIDRDDFYILAKSSLADQQTRILKHDETFAIFDRHGDIRPLDLEDHGFFHAGTRFLSRTVLKIEGKMPLLLSSMIREDDDLIVVDLTNLDFYQGKNTLIHRGSIHLCRTIFLRKETCYERIAISNYDTSPLEFSISVDFDADFIDIFELRGLKRKKRGKMGDVEIEDNRMTFSYTGLDDIVRKTHIDMDPAPQKIEGNTVHYSLSLNPHEKAELYFVTTCEEKGKVPKNPSTEEAFHQAKLAFISPKKHSCIIETSNNPFNNWLDRSIADLHMMLTTTHHGIYPYAGIPWYSTIFGRDGIITAFQTLWFAPEIARGVLKYLASQQAHKVIPEQDAEPGKIVHEERKGEMVNLKEIPFGKYYGTIDATPLFIVLAGHYYTRTGDKEMIHTLWPHIERALDWIDHYGDQDGDGFVEYAQKATGGLSNQGWKDSEDSIFHADGSFPEPPIALCEVQGYVYEAKKQASLMAKDLGLEEVSQKLEESAKALKEKFIKAFWCEELKTYAVALDGKKKPCRVRTSNAGQCLFSGIVADDHAGPLTETLLDEIFFSGWGIRTLPTSEVRYNPMSYHNGSVWPHDNSLIAYGMSQYGMKEGAVKVLQGLFDASTYLDLHRLPELFCGFIKRPGEGPTLYPVACDPQAWASGSVFLLLQACLGLEIHALENRVTFNYPTLPEFLETVTIKNLKVNKSSLDISLQRHHQDVGINVLKRQGDIEVIVKK